LPACRGQDDPIIGCEGEPLMGVAIMNDCGLRDRFGTRGNANVTKQEVASTG